MIFVKVPEFLKTAAKYALVVPAIREDWSLKGEIEDYVDVIKRTPNPQWNHCLNVLKTEYRPVGLFSHAARYSAAEEIKMDMERRTLKPMVEMESGILQPEEVSVPKAK